MDHLDELPPAERRSTPQEDAVLDELFGPPGISGSSSRFSRIEWKLLGATVVLFVVLANPWIDKILCNIPYCGGNQVSSLLTKTVIFAIILAVLFMYL